MTEPLQKIVLRHGTVRNLRVASFAAVYAAADEGDKPPEVCLAIYADKELDYTLHPGDTFPVRDQVWQLTDVIDPGTPRWRVVLTRIK